MAVNFGPLDYINNYTRGLMDDRTYMSLLAKTNTALYLMLRNPITQAGAYAQANIVYKRKKARVVSTGQYEYNKTIDPPHITGRQQMVMAALEYAIDGYDFESMAGTDLESVVGGSSIPRASARAFVNAYAEELMSAQADMSRDLNHFLIHGGAVAPSDRGQFGGDRWIGLKELATPGAGWGGLTQSDFGNHEFDGFDGNPQPQWAPVTKEAVGALNIGGDGDLALMMSILNHGGSQITPSRAFDATYVGICSQNTRMKIVGALGDQVRRPITASGEANPDVTGFKSAISFDEFNLMLYAETDIEDGIILVWNPACIRFAENNSDRRYVKGWLLSTTNYTATLPFRKRGQLWCCDLSQIGMLSGITSVTRT